MSGDFTPEQKRYLEGLASGLQVARLARAPPTTQTATQTHDGTDLSHLAAQDRFTAAGRKLSDQEKIKREHHPFAPSPRLNEQPPQTEFHKTADNSPWP